MRSNLFLCFSILLFVGASAQAHPVNNPVENYDIEWTDQFQWNNVISIDMVQGNSLNERFSKAQNALHQQGGGVVYFPPGEYVFDDHLLVKSGIVVRGSEPVNTEKWNPIVPGDIPQAFTDAREPRYTLGTVFHFPKYEMVNETGTFECADYAFKGIRAEDPDDAEFIAVVNLDIRNGHISIGDRHALQRNYSAGNMKGHVIVFGNILINTGVPLKIPVAGEEHLEQLWLNREFGAISVFACENVLVANNKIPEYDEDNFIMEGYRVFPTRQDYQEKRNMVKKEVLFDYQNRTGIRVNFMPVLPELTIWSIHEELQKAVEDGTYEELVTPGTLAKGIVIRNNYVFSSGGGGIKTTGDGAWVAFNIVKSSHSVELVTANGRFMDSHVNDVRAIEVRGWRWTVEGNIFDIHSNYTPEGIKYNDGEGIMHEAWENVDVRDSRIINNIGNQYICLWRVPVRGLEISGNLMRIKPAWHAIFVNNQTRFTPEQLEDLPTERVVIDNNITEGGGIKTLGANGPGNFIRNNRHTLINEGKIQNFTGSEMSDNVNYMYVLPE